MAKNRIPSMSKGKSIIRPPPRSASPLSKRERSLEQGIKDIMVQYKQIGIICAELPASQTNSLLARRRKLAVAIAQLEHELEQYQLKYCFRTKVYKKSKKYNKKASSETIEDVPMDLSLKSRVTAPPSKSSSKSYCGPVREEPQSSDVYRFSQEEISSTSSEETLDQY